MKPAMNRHVNMLEAKTNLSRLVEAVESGAESEIIIARNGKPVARLVPIEAKARRPVRLGLASGKFPVQTQEEFDADNDLIAAMFYGDTEQE
jgi:prevent-host-death family protein